MQNKNSFFEFEESGSQGHLPEEADFFLDILPVACAQSAVALAAFFDGEATPEETRRATLHLQQCDACRALLKGWRQSREILLLAPPPQTPPMLLPRILVALRLAALRQLSHRSELEASASPPFQAPTQIVQDILQATSQAPQVLAPARAVLVWRGVSHNLVPALPVFLIVAALSTQHGPRNQIAPQVLAPVAVQHAGSHVTNSARKGLKLFAHATQQRNKIGASTRVAAPRVPTEAPAPAKPQGNIQVQRGDARKTTALEAGASGDEPVLLSEPTLQAVAVTPMHSARRAAPFFVNLIQAPHRLEATARPYVATPVTRIVSTTPSRARVVVLTSRLMTGARSDSAQARISRGAAAADAMQAENVSPAAPRMTQPDDPSPPVISNENYAPSRMVDRAADVPRALLAAFSQNNPSSLPEEELYGADTLDNLRAATNSYRAALDAESDSDDAT